jgi:hypothetical protein
MERSKLVWSASGVAMALLLSVGAAHAANDKYTVTLNAVRNRVSGEVRLKTKLKVNLAASTTDGVGGMTIQIAGSGIDCSPNNDGGTDYKCGVDLVGNNDHVLALNVEFGGAIQAMPAAGLRFNSMKGKPVFAFTGKNKVNAINTALGGLVNFLYNQQLGLGFLKIHEPGSVPNDCDGILNGNPAGCLDGDVYAFEGLTGGVDCTAPCGGNVICWIASQAAHCVDHPADDVDCAFCHTQECPSGLATECLREAVIGVGCDSNTLLCCDPNVANCACANNADCGSGGGGFTCIGGLCQ